jgi:hypothetical protein
METSKENHYVYYSYEEWGRGYIGSRTCKCQSKDDVKYFGSFLDKTFNPTQKIILKEYYNTREEAYADEIVLQNYYKVVQNPHFANKAYQTSTSFSVYGTTLSEEHKRKISEARKGKSYPKGEGKSYSKRKGKLYSKGKGENHYNYGKTLSEETKKKISKATKGKKLTTDHKKKISQSNKGKSKTITEKSKNSVIIRAKARTGIPGHKHSEETKRKISEATQGKVPWNKGIKNPNITGGKSPAAKKIYYDGTIYDCILNAIQITNKSYYHIKKYGTIVS